MGGKTMQNKKSFKRLKKSYTKSETFEGQRTLGRTSNVEYWYAFFKMQVQIERLDSKPYQ